MQNKLPNYQTIPELGIVGRMDTTVEYEQIGLPQDLTGKSVLDIGCNEGAFILECLKRKAHFVQGVDYNEEWVMRAWNTIDEAKKQFDFSGQEVAIACENIFNFLGLEHKFDVILCLSVTHLNPNPNTLVAKCVESLKEGGLLILEVNHRLEKEKVNIPEGMVFYGKNKHDNRSAYHFIKNNS